MDVKDEGNAPQAPVEPGADHLSADSSAAGEPPPRRRSVPVVIGAGVAALVVLLGWMFVRADSRTNQVALSAEPKGVTAVEARASQYRASRKYGGTIEPWIEAKLGPQFTSAYVDTVLVRPGAVVKKGQVLATLDCRNASAESKAIAMQARALEAQREALSHQATRVGGLLDGGFVSPNEAEAKEAEAKEAEAKTAEAKTAEAKTAEAKTAEAKEAEAKTAEAKTAESVSKQAELLAQDAKLLRASVARRAAAVRAAVRPLERAGKKAGLVGVTLRSPR